MKLNIVIYTKDMKIIFNKTLLPINKWDTINY